MGVQEIKGKEGIQEYPNKRHIVQPDGFQERLIQNLESQRRRENISGQSYSVAADRTGCRNGKADGTHGSGTAAVGMQGGMAGVRVNAAHGRETVQPSEVRHMRYEESDNIEIAVTEGYTLKGKVEGPQVYVEAKYDDGRTEAYQVEVGKVSDNTQHYIERFAIQTTKQAQT